MAIMKLQVLSVSEIRQQLQSYCRLISKFGRHEAWNCVGKDDLEHANEQARSAVSFSVIKPSEQMLDARLTSCEDYF